MKKLILLLGLLLALGAVTAFAADAYILSDEIVIAESCPAGYRRAEGIVLGSGEKIRLLTPIASVKVNYKNIISVSEDGEITALAAGKASLRAYLADGSYADVSIEVKKAPESIQLSYTEGRMKLGESFQLKYTLSANAGGRVVWASSDESIVKVNENGLLEAVGIGNCKITAVTYNGLSAVCAVRVAEPAPAVVHMSAAQGTLYVGDSYQLSCVLEGGYREELLWESENDGIVSVDQTGLLTAVREGKALITASATGGGYDSCLVTVKPAASAISIKTTEIAMYDGGRVKPNVQVEGGGGKYSLLSMDASVVEIDPKTQEIIALRYGDTYVCAYTANFLFAECHVVVRPGPEELIFSAEDDVFAVGEKSRTFINTDGFAPLPVEYRASEKNLISISDDGVITGKKAGKCVLTVKTGGKSADMEIEILPIATAIALEGHNTVLGAGDTGYVEAELEGGSGRITYESSDSLVCAVRKDGAFTAVGPGECEISASLVNGVKASVSITVRKAPSALYLNADAYVLGAGDAAALVCAFDEGALATVTWFVEDESLIRMENGKLYSTGEIGETVVTAVTHNGLAKTAAVIVKEPPTEIEVEASGISGAASFDGYVRMKAGERHQLQARCEGYTSPAFAYDASHPSIAAVDASGEITAVRKGTSLITVSLPSGVCRRVLVSVDE